MEWTALIRSATLTSRVMMSQKLKTQLKKEKNLKALRVKMKMTSRKEKTRKLVKVILALNMLIKKILIQMVNKKANIARILNALLMPLRAIIYKIPMLKSKSFLNLANNLFYLVITRQLVLKSRPLLDKGLLLAMSFAKWSKLNGVVLLQFLETS